MGDFNPQIGTYVKHHINEYQFQYINRINVIFISLQKGFKELSEYIYFIGAKIDI